MRKLRMFNRVTPEGYFASPDGGLGWVVPEPELDRAAADSLGGTDAILFGRRTYEMFESFWPRLLDAPDVASNPHGARSPQMRAMAEWMRDAEKIVFSRTRTETAWANSRIVPALDPAAIDAMKRAPGKDIMVFGSGSLVAQLTEHGLIDEYHLVVGPLFLGAGRPLLPGLSRSVRLELIEAKAYPSGNVALRYARAG